MLIIHEELLPEAHLLILAASLTNEAIPQLAHRLGQAGRSNCPAVWVDCRLLSGLSPTAARLLRRLHHCLQQRQARLVLCRVSDGVARSLHAANAIPPSGYLLANSFDEAASYA